MAVGGTGATDTTKGTSSNTSAQQGDPLRGLDMEQFLKLLIAEMQNQDPLNPMENSEMLQQISQIRSVGATDKLTGTLDAVLLGQNLSNGSSLIGKKVKGLDDDAKPIEGIVDRVTVAGGVTKVHIGDKSMGLKNVGEILPAPADTAAAA
jgi:flagellar basal-body rod modification protein FlgD